MSRFIVAAIFMASAFSCAAQATTGVVAAARMVEISSTLRARIEEAPVSEGAHVAEGELLVRLDSEIQRARLARAQAVAADRSGAARAEAALAAAKARAERVRRAARSGGARNWEAREAELAVRIAEAELDAARAALRVAETDRALEEAALGQFALRAPFDGVVLDLAALPGGLANPGQMLALLVDPEDLEARFFMPRAAAIGAAQTVQGRIGGFDGRTVSLRLKHVDPRVDASSGLVKVVYEILDAGADDLIGAPVTIGDAP